MSKDIPLHVVFVEAWVKKEGRYLLAKRGSKDDQAAGHWAVPGGKVELGVEQDVLENSLKREILEEVGIDIKNIKFLIDKSFVRSSGHNVIGISFTADWDSGEAEPLDDQDEVRWVNLEEMDELLKEDHWNTTIDKLKSL